MLHYKFPVIEHINDVLPHIVDDSAFGVFKKDGYTVIDYNFVSSDTFPTVEDENDICNKMRREARGLIFDDQGKLIARRYHKFFNYGEREELLPGNVDFSKPHVILEKLDGSMVSPVLINDEIKWTTRMGVTFISPQVYDWLMADAERLESYMDFVHECFNFDVTPIFEWCSRKNRVVIDHPVERLVLTGMRENNSGRYYNQNAMSTLAIAYDIDFTKSFPYDANNILDIVRQQEGLEGVVIRFDDGQMLKIKCDWYSRIHKAKSFITSERAVTMAIVDGSIDDVLPMLPDEDKKVVIKFRDKLWDEIDRESFVLFKTAYHMRDIYKTPKDYALGEVIKDHNHLLKALVFLVFNGKIKLYQSEVKLYLIDYIKKSSNHTKNYLEMKELIFPLLDYRFEYEEN